MILPTEVLELLVEELNNNKTDLSIIKAIVGSEDLKTEDLQPPYAIVYSNFEDESNILDWGNPESIPVTIGVAIASGEFKTSLEAEEQVLKIGIKVIQLLQKEYEVINEDGSQCFLLKCKPVPLRFGVKSAALSSIICHFTYNIDYINGSN